MLLLYARQYSSILQNVSMRLSASNLIEPVPELNEPYAFVVIQPWIDAGSGGSLTLSCLGDIQIELFKKDLRVGGKLNVKY